MDNGYAVCCLVDPSFYDSPLSAPSSDEDFELAQAPAPAGWKRVELDDWLVYAPKETDTRGQGWKIHASACLDNAEKILSVVWDYCVPRRIPFKFIRSLEMLFLRNSKYADRGSSGKFVTIYPEDDAQFELILNELGALLEGEPGPYILSDLRWGSGPLYVRYGGFTGQYTVGADGDVELAIENDEGDSVPDRRGPIFEVPPWITLPACLEPHLEARNSATVAEVPYRIETPLHFSNGGGVYRGVDERTDETVVLKEARPHAGLAFDKADAVTRLRHERDMLERLTGLDLVPAVRDYFMLGEHHFLVQDFIVATELRPLIVERYPLLTLDDEAAVNEYTAWALEVYGRVEHAIDAVHERGVVIGDLHPHNILIRPDGRVALIDLEVATEVGEGKRPTLAAPGFMPPEGLRGFDLDRYALSSLRLYMFMPLTELFEVAPDKARSLAAEIVKLFPVGEEFLMPAVTTIERAHAGSPHPARLVRGDAPPLEPDDDGWQRARDSMAAAVLTSATPERNDRLFPGDIRQFQLGGLGLAHGAAGVLYALEVTGAGRYPEHEDWLVKRAIHPEPGTGLGLYDGLHGVAHVLERLGRREDALEVLELCKDEVDGNEDRLGLDLRGGLAGIGLNLAYFAEATGDASLWDAAWQVVDEVADRLGDVDSVGTISGGDHPYAGLPRGSSGPALLFLRLYEKSRETRLLDLAATALRQDLRRCELRDDGTLLVNEGWRACPYLAEGAAGIGVVLDDYLSFREDEQFEDASARITAAAEGDFVLEPGLFWGRAGLMLYLSRRHAAGTAAKENSAVADHVRRLGWHALTYKGHLAFPGEQLMRLSMDLATGTAGVMLALGAVLHPEPVSLPFLEPLRPKRLIDRDVLLIGEGR